MNYKFQAKCLLGTQPHGLCYEKYYVQTVEHHLQSKAQVLILYLSINPCNGKIK